MKALILTDLRNGHENQSVAFCEIMGFKYELCNVAYSNKFFKLLSYVLDFFGILIKIFNIQNKDFQNFDFFVGAGSQTYYALKFLSKRYNKKNIALMYPKGYKKDFSFIIATSHDNPKKAENIKILPVNLNFLKPQNFYKPSKKAIGFIIGGNNKNFIMNDEILEKIDEIRDFFKDYEFLITTSPRTPKKIESALMQKKFDFSVIYSKNPINPISDFLSGCEFVFITIDSVSMISEAVCNFSANIAILPLSRRNEKENKFDRFIKNLQKGGYLQIYSSPKNLQKTAKINLKNLMKDIKL